MKKLLILLFLVFTHAIIVCGQSTFKMGEYCYVPSGGTLGQVIGHDQTGYYFFLVNKNQPTQFIIEKYDTNLKRLLSKKLYFIPDGKTRKFEFVCELNNIIYLFSSYAKPSPHNKRIVDVQTVNKETLQLNEDLREVAEVVNFFSAGGQFEFQLSADKSKLLIYCDHPYIDKEAEKFGFKVLDADLREVSFRETVFTPDEFTGITSFSISNEGDLTIEGIFFNSQSQGTQSQRKKILVGRELEEELIDQRKKKMNYQYVVKLYRKDESSPLSYKISPGNNFFHDLQYKFDKNGDLVCAGFYSEKGVQSIRGVYYFLFDGKTAAVKKSSFNELGMDFITSNLSETEIKEVKKKLEKGETVDLLKFHSRDIIVRENGGVVLAGELIRSIEVSPSFDYTGLSSGFSHALYYSGYEYNDIAVISLDDHGAINWSKKIAKEQVNQKGNSFSSYGLVAKEDKVYLFYNDYPSNLDLPPGKKAHTWSPSYGGVTVLAEIDHAGTIRKMPLISSKETDVIMMPAIITPVGRDTLLIYGEKGEKRRYGIITLD